LIFGSDGASIELDITTTKGNIMKRLTVLTIVSILSVGPLYGQAGLPEPSAAKTKKADNEKPASMAEQKLSSRLGELFVQQWIQSDSDGNVRGSVVQLVGQDTLPLQKASVTLVQNGETLMVDETDIDGDFLMENVRPGIYTLVAESGKGMAIFALTVLDSVAGQHLPKLVEARLLSTEGKRAMELIQGQTLPANEVYPVPTSDPLKARRKSYDTHQVMMDSEGNVKGQLARPLTSVDMSSMTVYVLKDGNEVSRSKVSSDGKFSLRNLSVGCYGLIAAGDQGIVAFGFCAMRQEVASTISNPSIVRLVSMKEDIPSSLDMELGDPVPMQTKKIDEPIASTEVLPAQPVPTTPPGMGFGGGAGAGQILGGGGGGLGGGGLGGIGSLVGIGGLAAAAIIAADKNNDSAAASTVTPK
jgi:hypothetical protein